MCILGLEAGCSTATVETSGSPTVTEEPACIFCEKCVFERCGMVVRTSQVLLKTGLPYFKAAENVKLSYRHCSADSSGVSRNKPPPQLANSKVRKVVVVASLI